MLPRSHMELQQQLYGLARQTKTLSIDAGVEGLHEERGSYLHLKRRFSWFCLRRSSVGLTDLSLSCEPPPSPEDVAARRLLRVSQADELQAAAGVTPCKLRDRRGFSPGQAYGGSSASPSS